MEWNVNTPILTVNFVGLFQCLILIDKNQFQLEPRAIFEKPRLLRELKVHVPVQNADVSIHMTARSVLEM